MKKMFLIAISTVILCNNFIGQTIWVPSFGIATNTINFNVGIGTSNPTSFFNILSGNKQIMTFNENATGRGQFMRLCRVSNPNECIFSINSFTSFNGNEIKARIGTNISIDGNNGNYCYAPKGNKKAPFIEFNAEDGSISLFGENGSGSDWRRSENTTSLGLKINSNGTVLINNSVSIGISNLSSEKLDLSNGNMIIRGINNYNTLEDAAILYLGRTDNYIKSVYGSGIRIGTFEAIDAFAIQESTGKVGIGTISPDARLHIKTPNFTQTGLIVEYNNPNPWGFASIINVKNDNTNALAVINSSTGSEQYQFIVRGNGVVNAKKIYAEGFEVTANAMTIYWPDFVFNNTYRLQSLMNVEEFINSNGHLPEVPSENQVNKNGYNLVEMDATLLKKVEELTLYLIDQNKQIERLKRENDEFKNLINKN